MKGLYKNNKFIELNKISNLYSSHIKVKDILINNFITSLPSVRYDLRLTFNPKNFKLQLRGKKSFFIYSLEGQQKLNYLVGRNSSLKNLNFFSYSKSTLKFRKRKNIFFKMLQTVTDEEKSTFFQMPSKILFFWLVSKQITLYYNLDTFLLKLSEDKSKFSFYFLNLNFLIAYLNNLPFNKQNYMYQINILFKKGLLNLYLKEAFLSKLEKLFEKENEKA